MGSEDRKQGTATQGFKDLGRTVWSDIQRGDFNRTLSRDLQDLYQFYLDDHDRARLASMGRFRRWLSLCVWLLKSLIMRLTPARRIMLVAALLLFFVGDFRFTSGEVNVSFHFSILSFLIILVILMLELRDKVLAKDELQVGRAVQLALMPERSPAIPGWETWLYTRPANDVGGDLVDVMKVGDGRHAVALGDVAGKGLGAALLMAKLQSTLRAVADDYPALAALGLAVNRILCRDGLPGRFSTLLYLEVSENSGSVRVLNAGHMPPVVVLPDRLQTLESVAPPVGALAEATYREQAIEVPPGALLVAYSDGLTEAMNGRQEFFTEERLMAMLPGLYGLSPEDAGQRLLRAVEGFIGEERASDDLSLVLLKRVPAPPGPPAGP